MEKISVVSLLGLNCELVFIYYRRQDRKLLSVSHNQIALLCLLEKKNHFFYVLQCLILQPQCKHSLALSFGFIKLTFGQKKYKAKKQKKTTKKTKRKGNIKREDRSCLSIRAASHSGMFPLQVLFHPFAKLSPLVDDLLQVILHLEEITQTQRDADRLQEIIINETFCILVII